MGSFEKLGILVIVIIIVMILAVAIYQWGAGAEGIMPTRLSQLATDSGPLVVDYDEEAEDDASLLSLGDKRLKWAKPTPTSKTTWGGGVPRTYVVRKDDALWNLVFKDWRLNESFIAAIARENPDVNVNKLKPGDRLTIPDPSSFHRTKASAVVPGKRRKTRLTRKYEIQIGDNLEAIALKHLGKRQRWREIKALNPGLNEKKLKPFQVILVPIK